MNSNLKGIQKILASLTMATTVMSLAGFAALVPTTAMAVTPADYGLQEGWTISADGSPTDPNFDPDIYIVNELGYKRLFLNPVIFSFYGHLGGFAGVHKVSPTARDAFGTSGLFRNCETNDPKVYGVEITGEDVGTLHWVNTTGAQAVIDDPNFFKKVFCINNNEFNWYPKGGNYTSVNQVPNYSRTGSTPAPTGSVSVSLSSDNPSANTVIAGQSAADLAHFTFSGSGTVKSVTLNRIGVSADTTLSNVYLYAGSRRLTDSATVSSGKITFNDANGLFTVAGSTTISVKADIAASTGGQTVGVQLTGFDGNVVSLTGNIMTVASTPSDYGTISIGTSTPSSTTTLDPQTDYSMWQNVVSVGNHDLWLKSLQLRVIGSVQSGDLRNFRLWVDGVQVGSAVASIDANGYVVFDLNAAPFLLKTGSRTLKMVGDVVGGSNRNFTISLRQKPDLFVVDSQYGQGVLATGTFPSSTGEQDINQGSLTITKRSDSPSGDVIKDAAGVVLARFDFKAFGEKMKVENLRINFTAGNDSNLEALRNGALYADGVQIGSTQTIWEDSTTSTSNSTAYTEFSLGSSLIVDPGMTRVVEIRADIYDNNGVNDVSANDTITANIAAGSNNVQRMTSLNFISCVGGSGCSSSAAGNQLTVKTGSFTAAKYTGYANQSVTTPKTAFKIGHYTLTAASSEDINVTSVNVDVTTTSDFSTSRPTDMYLKVWNDSGALVYTSSPKSTIGYNFSASNSYSTNFTIPKTKTYQVEVYASLPSGISSGTVATNMDAAGLTTGSATSVTATQASGQTITASSASLNLANGSSPVSNFVSGGSTKSLYTFTLTPQYDDFVLDDATFRLSETVASSQNAVATVYLKDSNGTVLASGPISNLSSSAINFSGINKSMTLGNTYTFMVDVQTSNVGIGGNDTAGAITMQLSHLKYHDSNGNVTTSVVSPSTYQGNTMSVVKAYPTFTNVSLPSTVLTPGTVTLFKTQVTANGGQLAWNDITFTVASSSNAFSLSSFKLFEDGQDITSQAAGNQASTSLNVNRVEFSFATERTISSSRVYELRATVTGTVSSGNSVTTQVANPKGTTVTTRTSAVQQAAGASFVWSDLSAPSHSTSTDDWFTDGLVKDLAQSEALFQ